MSEPVESCGSEAGSYHTSVTSPTSASPEDHKAEPPKPAARRRLKHTKSRSGCKTCKRRKVKCDEHRPACTRCQRMGVSCLYLPEADRAWRQRDGSDKQLKTPMPIRSVQPPDVDPDLDLLSLELLFSYTEYTSSTLPSASTLRGFWKVAVPRIAFKNDYLMRSLLALAALHKADCQPEEREHYTAVALRHHHQASQSARILLKNITPENGTALFLFSVFTVIVVLNLPEPPSQTDSLDSISLFHQWYWTMQGIRSITDVLGSDIRQGHLAPLTTHFGDRWRLQDSGVLLTTTVPLASVADMLDELQHRLDAAVSDPDDLRSYTLFVNRLREAAWTMLAWNDVDVFVWLYRSLDDFAPLLCLPTQETMVLWAHLAVVVKFFERQWWLRGWADNIMSTVYQRLDWEHTMWVYRAAVEMNWVIPEENGPS